MVALADVLAVGQIGHVLGMHLQMWLCCVRGSLGMMCGRLDIQRYWHQLCTSLVAG